MVGNETVLRQPKRKPKPLDRTTLNDLALSYVARFSTSGARLEAYLARKIRERGVAEGETQLDPRAVVERLMELNYVDDEAYARARAGGLLRKGYGGRRVEQALRAAGIDDGVRESVSPGEGRSRRAALTLARKRGFGPFGSEVPDRAKREKQIAAMIRAGHGFDAARRLVEAASVEQAEEWVDEAAGEGDDAFG